MKNSTYRFRHSETELILRQAQDDNGKKGISVLLPYFV